MPCSFRRLVLLLPLGIAISGCEYAGLVRPSAISQLDPPVARLVNELPELDASNEATVAELHALGGLGRVDEGFAPELYGAPRGSALFVFALP